MAGLAHMMVGSRERMPSNSCFGRDTELFMLGTQKKSAASPTVGLLFATVRYCQVLSGTVRYE